MRGEGPHFMRERRFLKFLRRQSHWVLRNPSMLASTGAGNDVLAGLCVFRPGPVGHFHPFGQVSRRAIFQAQRRRGAAAVHRLSRRVAAAVHRLLRPRYRRPRRRQYRAHHACRHPLHGGAAVLFVGVAVRGSLGGVAVLPGRAAVRLRAGLPFPRRDVVDPANDWRRHDRGRHADRFGSLRAERPRLQAAAGPVDARLRICARARRLDLQVFRDPG